MHPNNIFLTLTYDEEHLESPRLIYSHWQKFMYSLRSHVREKNPFNGPIPTMVTGEYGEDKKRPHWHAIIFNYTPEDPVHKYTTDHDDKVYTSQTLSKLWNRGNCEYGSVTLESAGYVARYAAKKLVHGNDQDHNYHPIHRTSCKHAIGKSWIEKYHAQTFDLGYITLPNGTRSKIPRYYEDWYKKHYPEKWSHYVTQLKLKIQTEAEKKNRKEELYYQSALLNASGPKHLILTRPKVKETILKLKFKQLQERLKL